MTTTKTGSGSQVPLERAGEWRVPVAAFGSWTEHGILASGRRKLQPSAKFLATLARDWRVKVAAQKALALLPGTLAFKANEACVRLLRGYRPDIQKRTEKSISNLALLQRETGVLFIDSTVLEVGTGWLGIDLVLFSLLGARHIFTVDHHRHLTLEGIKSHTPEILRPQNLARLAELAPDVRQRAAALDWEKWVTLEDALRDLNVTALVSRSCLTSDLMIPPMSVDLFYSYSVLHRIPPMDLALLLNDVSDRLMRPGGVCFHTTDQCDLNSQPHVDASLWRLAYLKYPDWFFNTFISGRLNCQNRLRESDFIELLEASGIRILFKESVIHNEDVERMKSFTVAQRFRSKSLADLATIRSQLIGRKEALTDQRGVFRYSEVNPLLLTGRLFLPGEAHPCSGTRAGTSACDQPLPSFHNSPADFMDKRGAVAFSPTSLGVNFRAVP